MLNLLNDDHPKKIWAAKRVSWPRKKNIDYETRAISALESTFFQAGVLYEKMKIFKAIVEIFLPFLCYGMLLKHSDSFTKQEIFVSLFFRI